MNELKSIKTHTLYGDGDRSDSLKAYKAEGALKRAVRQNKQRLEDYFYKNHDVLPVYKIKSLGSEEKESYTLIDMINSKLTNSSISTTLNIYEIYKEYGIELAIERIHLQSNLSNI